MQHYLVDSDDIYSDGLTKQRRRKNMPCGIIIYNESSN